MRLSPRYYDRLQDFVHQSYMPVIESIQPFLQLKVGSPVLEVGCGTGQLAKRMIAAGYQYSGVEPDPQRVAHAQELCSDGQFIVSTGEDLDLSRLPGVDRAYIHGVLHHMDDDQCSITIEHLMSVPGMRLMIIEPFLPGQIWRQPLGYLLGKMDEGDYVRSQADYERLCGPWLVSSQIRSLMPRWPVPFVHLGLVSAG